VITGNRPVSRSWHTACEARGDRVGASAGSPKKEEDVQKQSYWSLFNRPDTLFGVCEGVGQDFGFNPNYLRVALAVAMIWNPVAVIATYALLGIAVAVSRWIAPAPVAASAPALEFASSEGDNDEEAVPVAKAA
jgi:phage shock protein PspC (stress-responsive transcriptional regulator)